MTPASLWYKDAIFYELYVRAFRDSNGDGHGDLQGVIEKMDYLAALGVTCIWLLPIYPSPLHDDGYDIADFVGIHPDYGTVEDFRALIVAAHARGLRVITDLVLNHTSDQHPWFQAAIADRHSPYRDYYVWSDSDKVYMDARIIFIDTESSNWTWDARAGQYYWHRFYSSQPDLNYENPAVEAEMLRIAEFWLDLGIDGFRADAVPYLYELEGTNCENLPQTHAFLRKLRAAMSARYPDSVLLLEANQWPEDVRAYFGEGDEAHMAFQFPVMPRIFMALKKGHPRDLVEILARTPDIPDNCQWCTFLRNHDELTLEMVSAKDRDWMWQAYAPDPGMRLNLGIRRRLAPLLENDRSKLELAHGLLFGLPGSPILYYGDELGMGDNIELTDRNGVRTPMQWTADATAGFSRAVPEQLYAPIIDSPEFPLRSHNVAVQEADPTSLLHFVRRLVRTRRSEPAFSRGTFEWAELADPAPSVAAFWRGTGNSRILALYNLSNEPCQVSVRLPFGSRDLYEVVQGHRLEATGEVFRYALAGLEWCWFKVT